ncbi:MAG: hypothetical protein WCO00_15535, partial [Rhodospirillaceae bacterium]
DHSTDWSATERGGLSKYHSFDGIAKETFKVLNDKELRASRQKFVSSFDRNDKRGDYRIMNKLFPLLARCLKEAGWFEPDVPAFP